MWGPSGALSLFPVLLGINGSTWSPNPPLHLVQLSFPLPSFAFLSPFLLLKLHFSLFSFRLSFSPPPLPLPNPQMAIGGLSGLSCPPTTNHHQPPPTTTTSHQCETNSLAGESLVKPSPRFQRGSAVFLRYVLILRRRSRQ